MPKHFIRDTCPECDGTGEVDVHCEVCGKKMTYEDASTESYELCKKCEAEEMGNDS